MAPSNGPVTDLPKVAVIYHFFPHYRAPVMRALANSRRYQFEFWGAHREVSGIPVFTGDDQVTVHEIGLKGDGAKVALSRCWTPVFDPEVRALIVLGNPNIPQTWLIALAARLQGKRILFWTHGWLRREGWLKAACRNAYAALADRVLVYNRRAQILAAQSGFPEGRVSPIYNSLDWPAAEVHYARLNQQKAEARPATAAARLICTARLIPVCRFDLLLEAMVLLEAQGKHVALTLVGDGPERERLADQAQREGLDVDFKGAIYDEALVSALIYDADLTVSPGKVGLTAIHSLSYGTPVITHDDFDEQMPEYEAIEPGVTGAFFRAGDSTDLARVIAEELARKRSRAAVRQACRSAIAARWTPDAQRNLIEDSLDLAFSAPT